MKKTGTIPVTGINGLRGTIDPSIDLEKVPRVLVKLESGRTIWVPSNLLAEQPGGGYYLPVSPDQLDLSREDDGSRETVMVIPVIAEDVHVSRKTQETGRVQIKKTVSEHEEVIDEPGFREQVEINRVPVNQIIENPASIRYEGDTMIIPVMEEILIVEKRIMLKEEIHVTKHKEEVREPQSVTLRKEEVKIERNKAGSGKKGA